MRLPLWAIRFGHQVIKFIKSKSCIEDPFGHVTYCKRQFIWVIRRVKNPPKPFHKYSIKSAFKRRWGSFEKRMSAYTLAQVDLFLGQTTIYREDSTSHEDYSIKYPKKEIKCEKLKRRSLLSSEERRRRSRNNFDLFLGQIPFKCARKSSVICCRRSWSHHSHLRRLN